MVFRIAHNFHPAAAGLHNIAFRNGFGRVIGAFRVNVGPDQADQLANVRRIEDEHRVNVLERRQNFCALAFRDARTPVALERARTGVRIHGNQQFPAEAFRGLQIPNVADVQDVKAAVGESDLFTGHSPRPHTLAKLLQSNQFVLRAGQGQPSITARSNSARVTVAVPRFITTIPPA